MAWCCGTVLGTFLLALAAIPLLLYVLVLRSRVKWSRKGIPITDGVHPVFGNMADIALGRRSWNDVVWKFYSQHKKKPFVTFYAFLQPMVMVNDLEIVKSVLVKDFSSFPDHNFCTGADDPMEYHNIFALNGQTWKSLRTKLSPTFTSGKMKKMFHLIDACGNDLITFINKNIVANDVLEVRETAAKYTTDVIATVGFGIEGNALKNPDSEFRRILRLSTSLSLAQRMKMSLGFLYPDLMETFNLVVTAPEVRDFCRRVVWEAVAFREQKNIKRNDFLDLLLQLKNQGNVEKDDYLESDEHVEENNEKIDLEGDKFVAQCFVFMVAGYETSSSAITHTLFELAIHPEIQQRAYEEITSVLAKHEGELSYEAVQEMPYLHMIISETLRKYPVMPFLDRRAAKPYRLPGTTIDLEEGQTVLIPVRGIHWDPDIYPDPERFDPERFNEENKQKRPPCTFLGFGEGPRICLGMRLAWLQVKIGLIHTLLNFAVSPSADTPIFLQFQESSPFSLPKGNIMLRFEKRVHV